MKSFLQTLLEGADSTAKVDITTNEEVEKEVNESCLPMDMLIESVSTDITIGLNRAVEVYEMACIVGGVKVVQEGTGQEGAAELLTEASDNFFSKILEKIKKIKDWFVAMIKKIGNKIASLFTNIDKAWAKYEADYRKNFEAGKFKFNGHIIDMDAADKFYENASTALNSYMEEIEALINDPSKMTEEGAKEMSVENLFKLISDGIGEEVENSAELTSAFKKAIKMDKESKEITVSAQDSETMIKVIIAATKNGQKNMKASVDVIVTQCNMLAKRVEAVKKQNGDNTNAVKYCTNAVTVLNTASSALASLVNTHATCVAQAAKAYIGFVSKVAQGKGVTESMDFSHIFENDDVLDDDEEIVEERDSFANFKAMKVWFGDNANATKELIKEANSEFASGDYKKAQTLYEKAKKYCETAMKEVKEIESDRWTAVFGVFLFGLFYYGIWRIVANVIVKMSSPSIKYANIDPVEARAMEKACCKDCRGTQKTIAEVLGKTILFCDTQIKLCKNPKDIVAENLNFDTAKCDEVFESIFMMLETMTSDDDEDNDGDGKSIVKESASILDIAQGLIG